MHFNFLKEQKKFCFCHIYVVGARSCARVCVLIHMKKKILKDINISKINFFLLQMKFFFF